MPAEIDIEVMKTYFSGKFHRRWQRRAKSRQKQKRARETKSPPDGQLDRGIRRGK